MLTQAETFGANELRDRRRCVDAECAGKSDRGIGFLSNSPVFAQAMGAGGLDLKGYGRIVSWSIRDSR